MLFLFIRAHDRSAPSTSATIHIYIYICINRIKYIRFSLDFRTQLLLLQVFRDVAAPSLMQHVHVDFFYVLLGATLSLLFLCLSKLQKNPNLLRNLFILVCLYTVDNFL